MSVNDVNDVNRTFALGHKNRSTASTNMNEHSSRSHALLCVEVTGVNRTTGARTLGTVILNSISCGQTLVTQLESHSSPELSSLDLELYLFVIYLYI